MLVIPYRRIVRATTIVFATWTAAATYWTWHTDPQFLRAELIAVPSRISWVGMVFVGSAAITLLFEWSEISKVSKGLRGSFLRGAVSSIGIIPEKRPPRRSKEYEAKDKLTRVLEALKRENERAKASIKAEQERGKPSEENLSESERKAREAERKRRAAYALLDPAPVLAFLEEKGPYQRLFYAVLSILEGSGLPASPRKGAHGDVDLTTHSITLAVAMANLWIGKTPESVLPADAQKKPEGHAYPLPVAIVAGLAHDIGKVDTFRREKDGSINVIGLHDLVGGRLLATLPEYWDIDNDFEQRIMAQAIRYYHHPTGLPGAGKTRRSIQTDKAVTDLMEKIRKADFLAGAIEGRSDEIAADYQDEDELPELTLDDQVWETFLYLMEKDSSAINHKSPARRIGYKQGKILYLTEKAIRERIIDELSITRPDYTESNNGNPGRIIKVIAARLYKQENLLITKIQGKETNPLGAAVYLAFEGTNASGDVSHASERIPHYLVRIDSGRFAWMQEIPDYPSRIIIERAVWPQYQVRSGDGSGQTGQAGDGTPPDQATQQPVTANPEGQVEAGPQDEAAEEQETAQVEDSSQDDATGAEEAPESSGDDEGDEASEEGADHYDPEDAGDQGALWDVGPDPEQEEAAASEADTAEADTKENDPEPGVPQAQPPAVKTGQEQPNTTAPSRKDGPMAQRVNPAVGSIEERRAALERARRRAEQEGETKRERIAKRMTKTPEQRHADAEKRVREFIRVHPGFLESVFPSLPEKRALGLTLSVIWMHEVLLDYRTVRGIGEDKDIIRVNIAKLLEFSEDERMANITRALLSCTKNDRIFIEDMMVVIQIARDASGAVQWDRSVFSAPVRNVEQVEAVA